MIWIAAVAGVLVGIMAVLLVQRSRALGADYVSLRDEHDRYHLERGRTVGIHEMVAQPLYDTVRVDCAGHIHLFHTPVGAGSTLFGSGPKHFGDTNLYLASQLPAGNSFRIRGVFVEIVEPRGAHPAWLAGATVELVLGAKRFLTVPVYRTIEIPGLGDYNPLEREGLIRLLERVRPEAHGMLLGSLPGIHLGFELDEAEMVIPPTQNFAVSLNVPEWGAGFIVVRVYLNGHQFRPVC